jgi:hypothetical protein
VLFFKNALNVTGRDVENEPYRRLARCLELFDWIFDLLEPDESESTTECAPSTTTPATPTTTQNPATTQSVGTTTYVVSLVFWVTYIVLRIFYSCSILSRINNYV